MPPMQQDREPMTLEQRVGRIEDVSAVTLLKYRYAAFCDAGHDLDVLPWPCGLTDEELAQMVRPWLLYCTRPGPAAH